MVGKVKLNNKPKSTTKQQTAKTNDTTQKSTDFSAAAKSVDDSSRPSPPPQPDKRLQTMDILIDKKLEGLPFLSVQEYHQQFWINDTFYSSWLMASGKTNVHVGQWQTTTTAMMADKNHNDENDNSNDGNEEGAAIINPWDGETYDCIRVVTFQFQRTTHLYTGNTMAHVTQTQYCRIDKNHSVVSIQIETQGVPFSDSFHLQLRWVATTTSSEQQQQQLHIQVGMLVVFTKPVIVANKIRAAVKEETRQSQVDLFRNMKKEACSGSGDNTRDRAPPGAVNRQTTTKRRTPVDDLLWMTKDVVVPFHRRLTGAVVMCFPFLARENDDREATGDSKKRNDVQEELDKVQQMLRTVRALPQSSTTPADKDTQRTHVLNQCNAVQNALDAILEREEKSRAAATQQRNGLAAAQHSRSINSSNNNNDHHPPKQPVPPPPTALQPIFKLYAKMASRVRAAVPTTPRNRSLILDEENEEESAFFDDAGGGPDPEPDKVLKGMNVIVSKIIHNATVMDVYKLLAEGDDSGKGQSSTLRASTSSGTHQPPPSFFRSWLEATDRRNVEIEPWSVAPPGELFVEEWSKEKFEKRRVVTARVLKSKFIKGALPVLAKQSMEQFCRLQGHDRLIMAASTKVDQFAFANTFKVCIRWVVSRVGSCDVSVKIGVFVLFEKRSLLESKIRAGASKETQRLQLDLFRSLRDAINSNVSISTARRFSFDNKLPASLHRNGGKIVPTSNHWFLPIQRFCIPKIQKMTRLYPTCMLEDDAVLKHEFQQIQLKLHTVKSLLPAAIQTTSSSDEMYDEEENNENDENEVFNFIQTELRVAYEALYKVVVWHGNVQDGPQILADASFSNRNGILT